MFVKKRKNEIKQRERVCVCVCLSGQGLCTRKERLTVVAGSLFVSCKPAQAERPITRLSIIWLPTSHWQPRKK